MAADSSFDIVSRADWQEIKNAVTMAQKEIAQRFDFKGVLAEIELGEDMLTLHAQDESKLTSLTDVLASKLVRRNISLQYLDYGAIEPASKGSVRQVVTVKSGLEPDVARRIVKMVKDSKLKVHAQVQDDQVRVSGKVRDDLQKVIALVRQQVTDVPLQFVNYR